jgi:hypothetical protein
MDKQALSVAMREIDAISGAKWSEQYCTTEELRILQVNSVVRKLTAKFVLN